MTVYVIRRKGDVSGLVKIGFTRDISRRLYDMSTATPEGFDLIHSIDAGRSFEAALHRRFASERVSGEWFLLHPSDIDEIPSIERPEENETSSSVTPSPDDEHSDDIVAETRFYLNELLKREWRGMGDAMEDARDRVMVGCGLPTSYGFRLQFKQAEMNDVSGEAYRALRLAYAIVLRAEGNLNDKQRRFLALVGMGEASN